MSPTQVRVGDTTYEGGHIVLATGSVPRSLPGLEIDGERVISSDHALTLDRIPQSVVVLGGGVIGVEFASVWRSFGAEVTIVEALPHLLPLEEESSSKRLERAFRKRGIKFELGVRYESVKHTDSGVIVTLEGGKTLDAEILLVAVGRGPVSDGLGLEEVGVEVERGFVKVDEYCRTNVETISAVGDLIPTLQLAHVGFAEGILVAERLGGLDPAPIDYDGVPRITYSEPEVASVGITTKTAEERGIETTSFTYDLAGEPAEQDPRHSGRGEGHRGEGRPGPGDPHGRQPCGRAHHRGPADLQLGGPAVRGRPADPSASHPVRGGRRGSSRHRRQATARPRLITARTSTNQHQEESLRTMSVSVTMPQLGESVTEGTVTRWLKKEGEHVEADEPLLEVSTDKVDTEIPSCGRGRPEQHHRRRRRDR